MMNKQSSRAPLWMAAVWCMVSFVPYLLGEEWGMMWVIFNFPLSIVLKSTLWGLGLPVYVAIVTLINASAVYLLVYLLTSALRYVRRKK
jgi:hypothetical protein